MNIFYLDKSATVAAEYHCNNHVVKMILEAGQMLCTAHWLTMPEFKARVQLGLKPKAAIQEIRALKPAQDLPPWGITHVHHPSCVWTRQSVQHYRWHSDLGLELCAEYTKRYQKHHKSKVVHEWLATHLPSIPDLPFVDPPTCMPEDAKVPGDAVLSYRNYYSVYKRRMAVWRPRAPEPPWF